MLLNNIPLVDRFNRPSVNDKVAIRAYFLNDGQFYDPYDVSACTIFSKLTNSPPNSIVDSTTGIIKEDQPVTSILMNFGVSGDDPLVGVIHDGTPGQNTLSHLDWMTTSLYVPGPQTSGIYRMGVGDYVAVLDGSLGTTLSGGYNIHYPFWGGFTVENGASSVQDYIDVWMVRMVADSEYQIFINNFQLYDDTFISITEPLIVTTNNRLVNKHVSLGSVINLMVTTELTVGNKTLSDSVKNILEDYGIDNASFTIQKVNEDSVNLPAREDTGVTGTAGTVTNITSDNTMILSFDASVNGDIGTLDGGPVGTYVLTAKYSFVGQTIVTEPFYFVIS